MANRKKKETVADFLGLQNHRSDCSHEINKRLLAPWKKSYDQPRQHIKKRTSLCHQICSQRYGFSNSFTGVSWTIKKAECQRIDAFELVLEKTLESLGLQGNQS